MTNKIGVCGVLVLASCATLGAWGAKAHRIQVCAAHKLLPGAMPAFFLAARGDLEDLACEPDRWRTPEQASLESTTGPDHTFKYEIVPKPLPPDRYSFIIRLVEEGKLSSTKGSLRDFGSVPYAIQEWAEMLTGAFRRWRSAREDSAEAWIAKRRLERSIVFMAGILSHWVTDASNPMHVSVHVHGWSPLLPNPSGYQGKELHGRFESAYVDRVIQPEDVERPIPREPRLVQDWLRSAESYIAMNNQHGERIFAWDKITPFGAGSEPPEARDFTAQRLADGARMLRDVWWSAWVKSGRAMGP